METDLISLFAIALTAFICPVISALIPKKLIPETVFLLVVGMLLGPNVFNAARPDAAISLLSDLGLGFLFLLAGYEIDPKKLSGHQGRIGFATWLVTFAIAIGLTALVPGLRDNFIGWMATAIALTTTAFGTLVPILSERGLMNNRIGDSILSYGTWGEICPIIAIALVLSTRKTWLTLAILAAFACIAVIAAIIPRRMWQKGARLTGFVTRNADTNSQMTVRGVLVLLIGLLMVSALFDLDIVLGSFAAGFVLRFILPHGDASLERKLNGIGYGFLIPLFFIVSGMGINPAVIGEAPLVLTLFIAALLLVRALPIYLAMGIDPQTRDMDPHGRATVALYCATALPLIVAVTTVATNAGAMDAEVASLLVAAGGISVCLMPLLASLTLAILKHRTLGECDTDAINGGGCTVDELLPTDIPRSEGSAGSGDER